MNLEGLADRLGDIVRMCSAIEVNRDRMLAGGDLDDGRRYVKEGLVVCEVGHSECSGHNDHTQGLQGPSSLVILATLDRIETHLHPRFPFEPHLLPHLDHPTQSPNEDICIETSFVSLVHDDNRISTE